MPTQKEIRRKRRHAKIRHKMSGTSKKPRLVVKKSLLYTWAQLIDDESHKVLLALSDHHDKSKGTKTEKAKKVGEELAKKALEQKIEEVVFDRCGYKYHGRIKALADSARENGLKF